VPVGQVAVAVQGMDQVQVLDQQVAAPRPIAQQGAHVVEPIGEFEAHALRRYLRWLRADTHCLVHVAVRTQGLFVARDNPKKVRGIADLTRADLRFVNRPEGSGTRVLTELLLEREHIPESAVLGFDDTELTHAAVAAYIASGMADVGIGVQTAAQRFGLHFIPLLRERYFFALRIAALEQPHVKAVLTMLGSPASRAAIASLAGYAGTGLRAAWPRCRHTGAPPARRSPAAPAPAQRRGAGGCGPTRPGPSADKAARSRTRPALAQTVGVGGGHGVHTTSGRPEVARHGVDLRLVEVRDRLEVGRAIAVLDEETLVVFEPVGRADHGVVQAVGMEVLHRLADALLVVGGRHDLQVFLQGQPRFVASVRRATRTTSLKKLMPPSVPPAMTILFSSRSV
jgi:molybdate-binding protein